MDERLAKALAIVQERTGFGSFKKPVRNTELGTGSQKATRGEQPRARYRPSKSRKRSQKDIDARKRWVEKKKLEALDLHPSDLESLSVSPTNTVGAVLGVPEDQVNQSGQTPVNSSTAGNGYKDDWFNFPLPIPDASRPAPQPQGPLTIEQAREQGLPTHYMGDTKVWLYRKEHGAKYWTACASVLSHK